MPPCSWSNDCARNSKKIYISKKGLPVEIQTQIDKNFKVENSHQKTVFGILFNPLLKGLQIYAQVHLHLFCQWI